jgi:hypothetical protein
MVAHQDPARADRCPRCSGQMYGDYDKDRCCMFCGEIVYATISPDRAADWDHLLPHGRPTLGSDRGSATAA